MTTSLLVLACLLSISHASVDMPIECTADMFQCETTDDCIFSSWQCDGIDDCPDGSDEDNCRDNAECSSLKFKCGSSDICLPLQAACNGSSECPDGSDEHNCGSLTGCDEISEFECEGSGECIPWIWQCDGYEDCEGATDEENCNWCEGSGEWIRSDRWCDGVGDCEDGSDEDILECTAGLVLRECSSTDFACEASEICVPLSRVCDTINDCFDNTDEACGVEPPRFQICFLEGEDFACRSGMCVSEAQRCDGVSDCDDGSDETGCECTSFEFRCGSNLRCVRRSRRCDGIIHCDDGSDEVACGSCADQGLWQCDTGECINHTSVCDGDRDCFSGIDEDNCHLPCSGLQFECDGRCWPRYYLCDTFQHCSGGEDEDNCVTGGCGVHQFSCANGTCLPYRSVQVCDYYQDCSEGEDEEDCGEPPPPGYPLGLASRYIPDVYITASSEYKSDFAPHLARASEESCWVPSSPDNQWLQVYFGKTTNVTGVVISGGGNKWDLGSWVTSFTLAFSMDGASWTPYKESSQNAQVFRGNKNRFNKVSRPLEHPVTSRYVRLYPKSYEGWIAVALEVYVTNDEDAWLRQGRYVPLGVGAYPEYTNLRLETTPVTWISDYAITASSCGYGLYPRQARLNNGRGPQQGACWSPAPGLQTDQWLQIKHDKTSEVAGVITQGAYNLDHWVTSYKLMFSLDGETWTPYTNSDDAETVFQGNVDNHRYVRHLLSHPVAASYTRFYPLTFHKQIALRVEILFETDRLLYEEFEAFCAGSFQDKGRICSLLDGCVPHKYQYGETPICEDILQSECGVGSSTTLDELGCLEIDIQFTRCEDIPFTDVRRRRSAEMFHYTQACDGTADCDNGKDEADCEGMDCALECSTESGDPCIPNGWLCDGIEDCLDGKDEQGCGQEMSKAKSCFFVCYNSTECLPTRQLGDGYPDCANGEDEDPTIVGLQLVYTWRPCTHWCLSVYGNADCIPGMFICDGDADCVDGVDELGCESDADDLVDDCKTIRCVLPNVHSPHCVPSHLMCDGHADCVSGEDEGGCDIPDIGISTAATTGQQPPEEGTVDQNPTEGQTVGQDPATEPTMGQGSVGEPGSHATHAHVKFWMVAGALGVQILNRHTNI